MANHNLQDEANGSATSIRSVNETIWDDPSSPDTQKDASKTGSRNETKHENVISKEVPM